jgi:hypothetical protein
MNCPKCGVAVTADEKFCSGCGAGIAVTPDGNVIPYDRVATPKVIASGGGRTTRKWLIALSIITAVSGIFFFVMSRSESEADIAKAEELLAGHTTEEKDAIYQQQFGMTFDEIKAHQRGLVNLQFGVNLALAVIYLGLWFWARTNPYAAALVAFLLFITVIVVSGVYEPKTLVQGILLKILFTIGLVQAIKAGREERQLLGAT